MREPKPAHNNMLNRSLDYQPCSTSWDMFATFHSLKQPFVLELPSSHIREEEKCVNRREFSVRFSETVQRDISSPALISWWRLGLCALSKTHSVTPYACLQRPSSPSENKLLSLVCQVTSLRLSISPYVRETKPQHAQSTSLPSPQNLKTRIH